MIKSEETDRSSGDDGVSMKQESRDDISTSKSSIIGVEEREKPQSKSMSTSSRKQKSHTSPHPSPQFSGYPAYHQQAPPPGRGPYHPAHGMHNGPRGPPPSSAPFPPPYYPGSAPHDHYRSHPHPHYPHQMPPMPHPGQAGPYGGAHGHYPNLTGRPGPPPPGYPHYNAPYPQGPPTMGYPGAPPPYPQSNLPHLMPSGTSDSASITSIKSKGTTKSSRKKRTIGECKEKNPPVAYTFCRTNSSASSSTIATATNNTESHRGMGAESPFKRERTGTSSKSSSANLFEEDRFIHKSFSNESSTSSVSVSGFSLSSFDRPKDPLIKTSPKRRKGSEHEALTVETTSDIKSIFKKRGGDGPDPSRFMALSMNESSISKSEREKANIFLSLSASPINNEVESNPTKKDGLRTKITIKTDMTNEDAESTKTSPLRKPLHDLPADTPTPPIPVDSEMLTDENVLNKHLRGQSFTPLPHLSESSGISPSNGCFPAIGPQLSWSIAGDAPSLEDLANCSWEESDEKKRPGSTTSQLSTGSRALVISPHHFSLWKDDHESNHQRKGSDSVRISMLSPTSEIAMAVEGVSGTTTPLPWSFEGNEERENINRPNEEKKVGHEHHHHSMFHPNSARKQPQTTPGYMWNGHAPPTPMFSGSKPPTPLFSGSNVGFVRSPLHGDRRDWFGHPPPGANNDRVRNLRGRMPHGAHLAPMPLHIPHQMASHHPLTSPMGIGLKAPMWSPHHGNMPPPMASPHGHMSPMGMSQSKRKCLPLKPPIPSKFQGDMEKTKSANVPEFTSLVNFPAHMSQKQSVNLPEGMRCCVMCGSACQCSSGNKKKGGNNKKADGSLRSSNGQDMMGDKNYAIIPTQNKGLCTNCDVNVWVVVNSGLEIKWCKGCKNFRPWAAFGDKGLATKCLRCRERQREKYALQKEEKEKARLLKGTVKV